MKRIFMVFIMILFFVSCDDGNKTVQTDKTGEENYPCFANDTCKDNLVCVNDICIKDVSNDTDDTETEDIEYQDDSPDIDDIESPDEIIDTETEDIEYQDEDTEDVEDVVELDDNESPDEITGDIYNCFNDTRYFYYNNDCWLKEEYFIQYQKNFDDDITAFEIMDDIRNECTMIGGRLPAVFDFRKNIFRPEFCQMAINVCSSQCKVFDYITNIDYKYNIGCSFEKSIFYNDYIYLNEFRVLTNNLIFQTKENNYVLTYFKFETESYINGTGKTKLGVGSFHKSNLNGYNLFNITCIKNI